MNIGLLWYDDNTKTALADKVIRAAARYRQKYGRVPNACYVHPSILSSADETTVRHNGTAIHVQPASNVLRHHFWIGEETREQSHPSATTRTLAPAT